jgi:hypothetical protein
VGLVVEFDDSDRSKVLRRAEDEIDVLAADLVQDCLSDRRRNGGLEEISYANLAEDTEVLGECELQNSEKGALALAEETAAGCVGVVVIGIISTFLPVRLPLATLSSECADNYQTQNHYRKKQQRIRHNGVSFDYTWHEMRFRSSARRELRMTVGLRYHPLAAWLQGRPLVESEAELSFGQIEELIGRRLPPSARLHQAWWASSESHSQARAWIGAGWTVSSFDLAREQVVFVRERRVAVRLHSAGRTVRTRSPRISTDGMAPRRRVPASTPTRIPRADSASVHPVVLVACAGTKVLRPAPAKDLYASALFLKSRSYAERVGSRWFILSAKHGLLGPEELVAPYDLTLKGLSRAERRAWAERVFERLRAELHSGDHVTFLAGTTYRQDLSGLLAREGYTFEAPLGGPTHRRAAPVADTGVVVTGVADLERFYHLLAELERKLGGKRTLGECHGRMRWPERGVYFFFEPEEHRASNGTMRVVRVGTHALTAGSKSTLWGRLRQHRGLGNGGGNHHGSIFRLHVGAALQARSPERWSVATWGNGSNADRSTREGERELEKAVSGVLGRMSLLWLDVGDDPGPACDRGYLERNSIGLLSTSGRAVDSASRDWLGHDSARQDIRSSGLWNRNHVFERYEPAFLDTLEAYVESAE